MSDPSKPGPLAPRLDRGALERVLARAAELQSGSGDTPEEFTEEQLLELGREVGLSPQHLRQALAEERTRSSVPEDEHGLAAALFGPGRARAARLIAGKPADILASIDGWMQERELLVVKRHMGERITWERRRDIFVGLKRALRVGGRDYALSQADEVSATVIAVDDGRVHVELDADFLPHRRRAVGQVAGSAVVGGAAAGALAIMGVFAAVAAAPVVLLPTAAIIAERQWRRHMVARSQLALEQILDRLEHDEMPRRRPDSLLGAVIAAATAIPPRRY
ncbi:MAG TPA: hypothetical protein VHB25_04725 [Gemmatimonadaceae bacterium]|nr:hypothetical protein [Gemmatimonadaceae bacterium]